MALDHDVVLTKDLQILEEIVVLVSDLMIDVELEKLDELKRIAHDTSLALSRFLLLLMDLFSSLRMLELIQRYRLNRSVEPLVERIASHLSAEGPALIVWNVEQVRAENGRDEALFCVQLVLHSRVDLA